MDNVHEIPTAKHEVKEPVKGHVTLTPINGDLDYYKRLSLTLGLFSFYLIGLVIGLAIGADL